MTLWHLDRKEKAAACLEQLYDEKLASYVAHRNKEDSDNEFYWPTAANVIRLDREAKALLGEERAMLAANFAGKDVESSAVVPVLPAKVDPIRGLRAIAQWQYDNLREEAAEESLSEIIRLEPNSADRSTWKLRGIHRWRFKRYEEALNDLNYVLETATDDAIALLYRCFCYRGLNQFPAALSDATRLIELAPNGYRAWLDRAAIYEELKQPKEALADIQKALEISGGTFDPWYEVSEIFALRGRVNLHGLADSEQVIADFTHALEQNLFSANQFRKYDVLLLRAAAYELEGEADKAQQDREPATALKH